ncbi:Hypothetical-Protein / belonging to T4-LIKE GC: 786 [Synechococcus phage S-PM2]|uniref:Hypothetical-Protein belonging to T4-LIKE GC: 786 n=1 Tax=Synechococcus phage S-PM2 TaxID=238854 RepID=Q5GQP7_BPSYP|nr:Hypothetical-Protein / belonging to T4-LIKE GC: 786 [Synechococcus phage S-PM2]CAF34105.1 Hypothetical-Protein / belonging to T4-LIKE GC: 786 [Synechococcus phage S-PM2]
MARMTNEQMIEIAEQHFDYQGGWIANTENLLRFARELCEKNDFYKTRCELLQKVQKYMRDPERQIVCDILANNSLLPDPSGVRYGQDLVKLIEND